MRGMINFLYGPLIDLYLATKLYAAAALYIQKEGRLGEPRYRKAAYHHQYLLDSAQGHYLEGDLTVINEAGLTILLRFAPFKGKTLQRKAPLEADFA